MNKIIHQIWIADSEDMMPCNLRILSNNHKDIYKMKTSSK